MLVLTIVIRGPCAFYETDLQQLVLVNTVRLLSRPSTSACSSHVAMLWRRNREALYPSEPRSWQKKDIMNLYCPQISQDIIMANLGYLVEKSWLTCSVPYYNQL